MGRMISTKEAAEYLGVSRQFLERDRWKGAKIPFVRIGAKAVRYNTEVLDRYMDDNTVHALA